MSAGHTPGPWHVDATKSFYVFAGGALAEQAGVEHGPFVCNASTLANAQLIATAPFLLSILKAIVDEAGPQFGLDDKPGTINRIAFLARHGIAATTGGQP